MWRSVGIDIFEYWPISQGKKSAIYHSEWESYISKGKAMFKSSTIWQSKFNVHVPHLRLWVFDPDKWHLARGVMWWWWLLINMIPVASSSPAPTLGCMPCTAPGCAKAGATGECTTPAGVSRESEALWGHQPGLFCHKTLIPVWLGDQKG